MPASQSLYPAAYVAVPTHPPAAGPDGTRLRPAGLADGFELLQSAGHGDMI